MVINVPRLEAILGDHADALGTSFEGYRNHVYRVLNFHLLLSDGRSPDLDRLAIAAAHHDLGIWTAGTLDYVGPSIALAAAYLERAGLQSWKTEVGAMIQHHHQLSACPASVAREVELFRRADWIDVTMGARRFGLPRRAVKQVRAVFPDAGFHRRLTKLVLMRFMRHPLNPLPMVRL
ncbi:hypothetical protein [Pseudoxanthomonas dokdonensis]|nr:hypothetical protein [Pseudoxanthomonas dokdonensis]